MLLELRSKLRLQGMIRWNSGADSNSLDKRRMIGSRESDSTYRRR